ncbi:MAG: hypothetical protein ACYDB9_09675 [Gammaproteobacteria bacterium]
MTRRLLGLRGAHRHCVAIVAAGGRRRAWTAWLTAHGWVAEPRDGQAYAPAEAAEVAALVAAEIERRTASVGDAA